MYGKQIVAALLVAVAISMVAAPAFAISAGEYADGAGTKLGRGVVNTATGWGEIPKQTYLGGKEGFLSGVGGFFRGIGLGVARTLSGVYEIATFWAPVPGDFKPMMHPTTVFDMPTDRPYEQTGSQP